MDFYKELMNPAELRNEELLSILNQMSDIAKKIDLNKVKYNKNIDREPWVSEEKLHSLIYEWDGHLGYPEETLGFNLLPGEFNYSDAQEAIDMIEEYENLNDDLINFLGAHRRALSCIYPPGGFISWHNNANASGYNILLTWSETGDGFWQHWDPKKRELVKIPDKPGWQCKYGYYGQYSEGPEKVCYHAAQTDCLRMTVAFVFNGDETGRRMAEMLIEEIETP